MKAFVFCALLFGAFTGSLYGQVQAPESVQDATGQTFPRVITVNHGGKQYTLEATGAATRRKLIVNVYAIASYVQQGTPLNGDKNQALVNADVAKQLTMKWLRDVEAEKIRTAYTEGYEKNLSPEEFDQLRTNIDQFIGFFTQDARKGQEYVIRSFPGGEVEVLIDGQKVGSTTNPAFAKATWNIWLGQNSVVDRAKLVR